MSNLVGPEWLADHPDVRICDVRWSHKGPSGRELYEAGHIPGALFVDLDRDLSRPGGPGRHPLPDEASFAQVLARLGVWPDMQVVAYDMRDGSVAARFWFMLKLAGHARAAVLDGGLKGWTDAGFALSKEAPVVPPAPVREVHFDRARIVDRAQIVTRGGSPLIDVRAPERYRGEKEPIDKIAGHIPGSVNLPLTTALDERGRFRPTAELRALHEQFGADAIISCGSGVTACHTLLTRELAGLPPARLYVGSWSDWISDPAAPIKTGGEP